MNFIQQAYRGKNNFFSFLGGLVVTILGWGFLGSIPLAIVAVFYTKDTHEYQIEANTNFMHVGMDKNLYLFLMLLSFVIGLVTLFFVVKKIHNRSIKSIITSRKKIDWKRILFSFNIWFTISVIMLIVGYISEPNIFIWNFKPIPFLILVVVSFLFIPLQTSLEELLFRGYIMQHIGVLVKNRWFPLFFTSILFGVMHGANPEVDKIGPMIMIFYIGTGLFLGIITLMDEGTELALGFHAANNIVGALFVTQDWVVFQTDALLIDTSKPDLSLEAFFPVFILYPILFYIFYKKYHWSNTKKHLFGKIDKA